MKAIRLTRQWTCEASGWRWIPTRAFARHQLRGTINPYWGGFAGHTQVVRLANEVV
jgi:hypothetical protein